MAIQVPNWVTYPGDDWASITPEQAGLDVDAFDRFVTGLDPRGADFGGEDHTGGKWGAVLTRGGYLLHEWGNRHYRFQTASVGKAFAIALLGLAVEAGMVSPDELISNTWTGEGQLSHPHKYLTEGHHKKLTWNHLIEPPHDPRHYGGFAIELGNEWQRGRVDDSTARWTLPEWAKWTGDPFYDLYAHVEPGTVGHYSSAGFWRLGQALTALWDQDLKEVLDERLFGKIGIPPKRWDWYAGKEVQAQKYFYPTIPDSYTYLDPPFEIEGQIVRSAPGWVVISASDLARFGHLVSTQGLWKGKRLIGPEWLRGHGGGNRSGMSGESGRFTAMGVVTTKGLDHPHSLATKSFLPEEVFLCQVKVSGRAGA